MDLSKTLDKVFLVLPNYCLGQCISDFYQNYEFIQFCTSSVEAIFICKAFSESLCWSSPGSPDHPTVANWGGLCGVGAGAGQYCGVSNPGAVASGAVSKQKLGSG